jgi:hypothetical protein
VLGKSTSVALVVAGVCFALPAMMACAQSAPAPITGLPAPEQAAPEQAQPQTEQTATPVLLELFTSEGCSSCPPAEDLLSKLDGTVAPSGQQIVVLSEHVTYWNHLGWNDPFSKQLFTDRQSNYSDKFGTDEVYTPEIVVNGARDVLGSDRDAVLQAVKLEGLPLALNLHVLSVRPNGDRLTVVFSVEGKVPQAGAEIYAVLADDAETRRVTAGENAGRTLVHVAVARAVGQSTVLRPGEQTMVSIPMPLSAQAMSASGRRLILIAQMPGQGRVVGLASQEMPIPAGNPARQMARAITLETR